MKGLGTSPGIGIGKIFLYKEVKLEIERKSIEDFNLELERFSQAMEKAKAEIDCLYDSTVKSIGEKEAEIFSAHKMMLEDPEFIKGVEEKIKNEKINAESAVKETADAFIALFENIEDEYLKARAVDLKDVSYRVLRILLNKENVDLLSIDEKSIIVAEDLTPSDTASMNKDMVVGLVTELGGRTSHTSIIARTLEIPAIAGIENITEKVSHGDMIIIDGDIGELILNPTKEELDLYRNKFQEENLL